MGHPQNRAERRRKERLLKARATRMLSRLYGLAQESDLVRESVERRTNNLANCSCPCCGNPRRHFGEKTLQECRQDLDRLDDQD